MEDGRCKMADVFSQTSSFRLHTSDVAVVEAEKTAVILSEHYPAYLWLADVSPRTFSRYLDRRREILKIFGVSPKAQKLPPYAVRYICEDYCIDLPPELQDQQALNASPIRDIILKSWEEEQNFKNISRLSDKVGQRPAQM